jgi:valyl-tRNA synthetase
VNDQIEKDFDLVQKVAKAIRSARSDYNIPSKTKTDAYIICSDENVKGVLKDFRLELQTLSYCASIENVSEAPSGCAILTINAGCDVHLMLKGIIEVEKELAKLDKKREQLLSSIAKLKQKMSVEDYDKKVPENIQKENTENLEQSVIEIERVALAIESLKLM